MSLFCSCSTPPHLGFIKLNSDVAIKNGFPTAAVVAQNHADRVCNVCVFKEKIDIPVASEFFDSFKVVQVAILEGWKSVCIESDAQVVIQNSNNSGLHLAH